MDNTSLIISANVIELRDALGLSQKDFALLSLISTSTLVNIESGKKSFRIKSLDGIINFTTIKLEDLSKRNFVPSINLREILAQKYKSIPAIQVLLSQEPSIPYCIKYKMLPSGYLDIPRETSEIKSFFLELGWNFKANSLHTALKRMTLLIKISPHPKKSGTNLYSKI
ncbi:helix-turn-helix transcriptional regulator [Mucilaginibacter sp. ZT4R22]|uniref:Helix-turn-helix transcriptional regulator n=1 Tax=Mucilaginibacter pankratovii TaxID=2772110 RepID=A0ABR7WWA9_9SPHI|nr:helix-turn-helix transcriptional regulator [Mucilaginibacter pankratovii]MBD1366575.1 helix-turn-helix transcriptional regulator [Mucilaginibacter pankratovii]